MRSTGQPKHVRRAPPGFFYAPMPEQVKGSNNRVLQGGFPPVPYRAQNNWVGAGRGASEPWSSRQIKMEVLSSKKDA